MNLVQSEADPHPRSEEHRRSGRFTVVVPVQVMWCGPGNEVLHDEAEAVEVSLHGAVLRMKAFPPEGTLLDLTNRISNEKAQARVVAIRGSRLREVAVELVAASETFWGVTFRLKKATTDLRMLEQDIKSVGADPRVLEEFRDAVDYIRKTAWVVYEWQERHLHQKDASTVLSLLTMERLRRATQLNEAIAADLQAHEIPPDPQRLGALLDAIENLGKLLRNIVENSRSS